jgi:hypothetical protein
MRAKSQETSSNNYSLKDRVAMDTSREGGRGIVLQGMRGGCYKRVIDIRIVGLRMEFRVSVLEDTFWMNTFRSQS